MTLLTDSQRFHTVLNAAQNCSMLYSVFYDTMTIPQKILRQLCMPDIFIIAQFLNDDLHKLIRQQEGALSHDR